MTIGSGIIYWGQIAAALSAIFAFLGLLIKYAVVKPIKQYIDQKTYQIQPYANGGRSLADAVRKLEKIEIYITDIDERLQKLESKKRK